MRIHNFTAEQLYWYVEFGRPRRKISVDELKQSLDQIDRPVFFLSTGRTGTQWFANLFSKAEGLKAYHAPSPDLSAQNVFAYKLHKNSSFDKEQVNEILNHIFLAGREAYLRYSFKSRRRYLETNNHITFFAHSIAELLPQAKFVHIHRHPGDFVSSGLKRNWYSQDGEGTRQITPVADQDKADWSSYSELGKIAWLWKETNSYIETFKQNISPERIHTFNFSSMDADSLRLLIEFTETRISENRIRKEINHRLNDQRFQSSEKYSNWPEVDRQLLADICNPLATQYQYKL
jgi:hypothetical protein